MDAARIPEILTDPVTLDLVERQPVMRIAYAAADGSPRVSPRSPSPARSKTAPACLCDACCAPSSRCAQP